MHGWPQVRVVRIRIRRDEVVLVTVCFVSVTGLPFAIVVRSSHSPERGFLRRTAFAAVAGAPDAPACEDLREVADPCLVLANRGSGKLCDLGRIDSSLVSRRRRSDGLRCRVTIDRSDPRRDVRERTPSPRAARVDASRGTRPGIRVPARRQLGAGREAVQLFRGLVQTHRSGHAHLLDRQAQGKCHDCVGRLVQAESLERVRWQRVDNPVRGAHGFDSADASRTRQAALAPLPVGECPFGYLQNPYKRAALRPVE